MLASRKSWNPGLCHTSGPTLTLQAYLQRYLDHSLGLYTVLLNKLALLWPFPCSSTVASLVALISIHLSAFQLPEFCSCRFFLSASVLCLQRKKSRCYDTTESVSVEGSESVHHLWTEVISILTSTYALPSLTSQGLLSKFNTRNYLFWHSLGAWVWPTTLIQSIHIALLQPYSLSLLYSSPYHSFSVLWAGPFCPDTYMLSYLQSCTAMAQPELCVKQCLNKKCTGKNSPSEKLSDQGCIK